MVIIRYRESKERSQVKLKPISYRQFILKKKTKTKQKQKTKHKSKNKNKKQKKPIKNPKKQNKTKQNKNKNKQQTTTKNKQKQKTNKKHGFIMFSLFFKTCASMALYFQVKFDSYVL